MKNKFTNCCYRSSAIGMCTNKSLKLMYTVILLKLFCTSYDVFKQFLILLVLILKSVVTL